MYEGDMSKSGNKDFKFDSILILLYKSEIFESANKKICFENILGKKIKHL